MSASAEPVIESGKSYNLVRLSHQINDVEHRQEVVLLETSRILGNFETQHAQPLPGVDCEASDVLKFHHDKTHWFETEYRDRLGIP